MTAREQAATPVDPVAADDAEKPARRLGGRLGLALDVAAALVALLVLWQVFRPFRQGVQFSLMLFLGLTLPMVFLRYRARTKQARIRGRTLAASPARPSVADWLLAAVALVTGLYPVLPIGLGESGGGYNEFLNRQGDLTSLDVALGLLLTVLVLEACRRTTGLILVVVCLAFLAYAYYGGLLPLDWPITHAGLNIDEIVNALYNDQSGFYGTPLYVAASYIVLFAIYGAVLNATGATEFFVDLGLAVFRRSRTAPGKAVTLSGLLLGTVSGSGTATTVTLGSVSWPILRRAGYPAENAGGLLAAAGIGAILSPPTLGAAAFIVAEYLGVSYAEVLVWAIVPTLLYYLGIFLAVEIDARRYGTQAVDTAPEPVLRVLRRGFYHLISLGIIVAFLAADIPVFRAVVYATAVAAAFGLAALLLARDDRTPGRAVLEWLRRMFRALAEGIASVLPVVAVCASAGVITAVMTKTGLGQRLGDLMIDGGQALVSNPQAVLVVTAVLAAVAVALLGLAVPVTASFIIAWVILAPAFGQLEVAPAETAMFIFYYAVLSEVTPPTALAAVAAAAITGANAMPTMWQTWKYTLPAFLVPLAFVSTDAGAGLVAQNGFLGALWTGAVAAAAVAALAFASSGWLLGPASVLERGLFGVAAVMLLYLEPVSIGIGLACVLAGAVLHVVRRRGGDAARPARG
jgi:TRAP transporter 4TM/12TM fusion protein